MVCRLSYVGCAKKKKIPLYFISVAFSKLRTTSDFIECVALNTVVRYVSVVSVNQQDLSSKWIWRWIIVLKSNTDIVKRSQVKIFLISFISINTEC